MEKLNKMSVEVLGQMAANPTIFESMSSGMRKVGATLLVGIAAMASTGIAHAGSNNALGAMVGLGGVTALMMDGTKSDEVKASGCDVQGKNGWKVVGATTAGAYAGNNMGNGKGKTALTVLGGLIAGSVVNDRENDRIQEECNRDLARKQQAAAQYQYQQNQQYQQPHYQSAMPTAPVLYAVSNPNNGTYYVTAQNSPGVSGLLGKAASSHNLDEDPVASSAVNKTYLNLKTAYTNLDQAATNYQNMVNGNARTQSRMGRYIVDDADASAYQQASQKVGGTNRDNIAKAKASFEQAYVQYAVKRAYFMQNVDNAVQDGYNVTQYGDAVNYLSAPQSAMTREPDGSFNNKYATIPGVR